MLGYAYASRYRERPRTAGPSRTRCTSREDAVGRGIGKALLGSLIELLRELGYVKLYAVITPPNTSSVALHEKFGFVPLCRFRDTAFKHGCWQAIDWMELSLRETAAAPAEPIPFPEFAVSRPERLAEMLEPARG